MEENKEPIAQNAPPRASEKRKKKVILICAAAVIVIGLGLFFLLRANHKTPRQPAVIVETPGKIAEGSAEELALKLSLTALGGAVYPAASFSVGFDPAKLEFLGLGEGNVPVTDSVSASGTALPEWSVNAERANKTGIINVMYLDMTGGKNAFSAALTDDEYNVLLTLRFRLRGGAKSGDILELTLEDAVFAAADETQSLASTNGTLLTVNGRIVIGEAK